MVLLPLLLLKILLLTRVSRIDEKLQILTQLVHGLVGLEILIVVCRRKSRI
jgi:hypothetical protein